MLQKSRSCNIRSLKGYTSSTTSPFQLSQEQLTTVERQSVCVVRRSVGRMFTFTELRSQKILERLFVPLAAGPVGDRFLQARHSLLPTCILIGASGVCRESSGRVCVWRYNCYTSHPARSILQLHHDGSDGQTGRQRQTVQIQVTVVFLRSASYNLIRLMCGSLFHKWLMIIY